MPEQSRRIVQDPGGFETRRAYSVPGAQYKAVRALTRLVPSQALQRYQSMGRK